MSSQCLGAEAPPMPTVNPHFSEWSVKATTSRGLARGDISELRLHPHLGFLSVPYHFNWPHVPWSRGIDFGDNGDHGAVFAEAEILKVELKQNCESRSKSAIVI